MRPRISIRACVRPSIRPSVRPFVRPSICLSVLPSVRPSVRAFVRPSVRPAVRPRVRPPACPSVRTSVRPSSFHSHAVFRPSVRQFAVGSKRQLVHVILEKINMRSMACVGNFIFFILANKRLISNSDQLIHFFLFKPTIIWPIFILESILLHPRS